MLTITIYDKSMTPLTTLTEVEVENVKYRRVFEGIGDCSFTVKTKGGKVNATNFEMLNRVAIKVDNVVRFTGVIMLKDIKLDTVDVRCKEAIYVLQNRLVDTNYVANGTVSQEIADLLTAINTLDDTKITAGDLADAIGSVNATFNRANALDVLTDIVSISGNEYRFNPDQSIDVKENVGNDLSASVIFRYETDLVEASNIVQFNVTEDGEAIVTRSYGKSGGFSSTQEDAALKAKYGVVEKYRDFRVANTSAVLDDFTAAEIADKSYAPAIDLNPDTPDNFDAGDSVKVIVKNALVSIDDVFKVREKVVEYIGNQTRIKVNINDLPNDLETLMRERDRRLDLLEKQL